MIKKLLFTSSVILSFNTNSIAKQYNDFTTSFASGKGYDSFELKAKVPEIQIAGDRNYIVYSRINHNDDEVKVNSTIIGIGFSVDDKKSGFFGGSTVGFSKIDVSGNVYIADEDTTKSFNESFRGLYYRFEIGKKIKTSFVDISPYFNYSEQSGTGDRETTSITTGNLGTIFSKSIGKNTVGISITRSRRNDAEKVYKNNLKSYFVIPINNKTSFKISHSIIKSKTKTESRKLISLGYDY